METPGTGILRAGVGRTDITPPDSSFLEGFAGRDHCAEGVHDRLKATALALSDGVRHAVILTLDILDFPDSLVELVWKKVQTHYHIEPRQILINSSHTHAGPMVWPRIPSRQVTDSRFLIPDERYLHTLVENVVTAVGKALGNIRPARARWGVGETRIGICRRARDVSVYRGDPSGYLGLFANLPNPDKEVDRTCPVLFLTDPENCPVALMFGASCHPTTMSHDNYLVSAEYPGAARRVLEDRIGVPALFLQGMGGDVKPRRVAEEHSFRSGTYEDVDAVGEELARDVLQVMDHGLEPLEMRLGYALRRFPVPLAPEWDMTTYRGLLGEENPTHRRAWAEWWLDRFESGTAIPREVNMTLSILQLSPTIRFLGTAGELLTDLGVKLRGLFPEGNTFPLGYSNGRTGYLPDSTVLREGGYEALESIFFSPHMPAPWRGDIDETLAAAFRELEREAAAAAPEGQCG